jgi:subtilisin family serine protease
MTSRYAKFWAQFDEVLRSPPEGRVPKVYPPDADRYNDVEPLFVYEDQYGLVTREVANDADARRQLNLEDPDPSRVHDPVQRVKINGPMPQFFDNVRRRGQPDVSPHHLVSICDVNLCPAGEPLPTDRPYQPLLDPEGDGNGVSIRVVDTGLIKDYPTFIAVAGATGNLRDRFVAESASGEPTRGSEVRDSYTGADGRIRLYGGHGTFIAGLIGCVAPEANVHVTKALEHAGAIWEFELGPKLLEALRANPDIISLSAGGTTFMGSRYLGLDTFFAELDQNDHTLVVAAAGNEGIQQVLVPAAMASHRHDIVSVGALRYDLNGVACFSNYGPDVTVYAPGERMINAFPTGDYQYTEPATGRCRHHNPALYAYCTCVSAPPPKSVAPFDRKAEWSGTSFATPIVAAMVASHWSKHRAQLPTPRAAFWDLLRTQGQDFDLGGSQGTDLGTGKRLIPPAMQS